MGVEAVLPSFSSEKKDVEIQEWIPAGMFSGVGRRGPDMVGMSKWAFRYLLNNPQRPLDYECRFLISPLDCPPALADNEHDPVAVGDTESRMELEFIYMREMSGTSEGWHIENAIRSRILSYVKSDGLCWNSPCAMGSGDREAAASPWSTGHLLRSSAERYQRTGDEVNHKLCRKLVEGLKLLATSYGNLMYYEGGLSQWRNGKWINAVQDFYPSIVNPLIRYWEICREQDVLEFAEMMAEGIVQGIQSSLDNSRIRADGSHTSTNCHLVMRAVLGVAQVGLITGNSRYVEWARRTYEFTRANGTDWGWYPENIKTPEKRYWSETCITGDMVECATAFAMTGYSEYWDHIERSVRNYLPEAQFFLKPEFVDFYRSTHFNKTDDEIKYGLKMLKKFEGGFLARQRPNDWVYRRDGRLQVNMMGCCPPEGMRALYTAWINTVREENDGVYINMCLDRDSSAASVTTYAPQFGRLDVEVRRQADYYVRPPSWAPQEDINVSVNGKGIIPKWKRSYIRVSGVKPGDVIRMDYMLPVFTQTVAIGCEHSEELYKVHWIGNDIEEVTPHGKYLPIFNKSRQKMPELPLDGINEISGDVLNIKAGKPLFDVVWPSDA